MSSDWERVDSARDVGNATLLKSALEQVDIEAWLRGEHLPSIAGELPLNEAMVEVWVHTADAERARTVLKALHDTKVEGPPLVCPRCSEESPPNFELCWNCQGPLTASEGR